jgi:hypothetical protein
MKMARQRLSCWQRFCCLHILIKIIDANRNEKRGETKQEKHELNEKTKTGMNINSGVLQTKYGIPLLSIKP